MEVCASLSLPDCQPRMTAVQAKACSTVWCAEKDPILLLPPSSANKGAGVQTPDFLKKMKCQQIQNLNVQAQTDGRIRGGKGKKGTNAIVLPTSMSSCSRQQSSFGCHLSFRCSSRLCWTEAFPTIPAHSVPALPLGESCPAGWAISEEALGPLHCSSLCAASG